MYGREAAFGGRSRGAESRIIPLSAHELQATFGVIQRVRAEVPADLNRVLLFGSRAREEERADSDVDLLLIFRRLPQDREPQAGQAEAIAEEVAAASQVPVTVWSVSFVDLRPGNRTPMLVDALTDGVPLWPVGLQRLRVVFTPEDALRCVAALLTRVSEGSEEVAGHLCAGDRHAAAMRMRDDLVRMCVAGFLLAGETRPRRAEAVRGFADRFLEDPRLRGLDPSLLRWAEASFGLAGRDEEAAVPLPPRGFLAAASGVEVLRQWIREGAWRLERRLQHGNLPGLQR